MMNEPKELSLLSTASRALCEARTVDEVKDIRDKAEAVKAYARKAKLGHSILLEAALVKVRAERKLGGILSDTELAKSAPGNQFTGVKEPSDEATPTLATLGITKSDSSRFQQIANLPEDVFQSYVKEAVETEREPTTAGLLKLAKRQCKSPTEDPQASCDPGFPQDQSSMAATTATLDEIIGSGRQFATILAEPACLQNPSNSDVAPPLDELTMEEVCALPISAISSAVAHLHLWSHAESLLDSLDVMEAWGFEYRSCFVWADARDDEPSARYWRPACRLLLLGSKGEPIFSSNAVPGYLKPNQQQRDARCATIRAFIERVSPGPYLQLFASDTTNGWTTQIS
jgi:N6-adenosine-specific RNA methylase IME4